MIRQLTAQDDVQCQQLIKKYPAENLFIIGDIEAFGYDQPFQTLWGDFEEDGSLRAVLLRYEKNFIPFAEGTFDAEGFAHIINEAEAGVHVSGLKQVTDQVTPYIQKPITFTREMYYAKCSDKKKLPDLPTERVKLAGTEDLIGWRNLMTAIPEFVNSDINLESKKRNIEKGVSRIFFIEEDGEMVSTAATEAENSLSAMIVAVGTVEKAKRKGYATICLTKLCTDLLDEGKELCLFYDNPEAGAIYKRIGFEDIGTWVMTKLD
ncbi:GNAT family N-acetyltransferase [Radiobacillus kanasensis]|uniref:GNAT family N-acetyltransferase n=1 Tax=Radiobacillus kanasensis TaxID=2844358 RepID=UPI001E33911C|nr:GNAT family N-acetyltransferase [Radiobacillus kanasensis]UFT98978.1 GNAT family N-acetyltransferase [Radiobacillus kanasensis]